MLVGGTTVTGITGDLPGLSPPMIPDLGKVGRAIQDLLTHGSSPKEQGEILSALDRMASVGADTLRGISDLASKTKQALTSMPSEAANALADSMRGPFARKLTLGETAALRQAFGSSIDLTNVRIVNGAGYNPDAAIAFKVGGNPAITEGNTVYIRSDHHSADLSSSPEGINTLVHEFTHVRQYQQMGFGSFAARYASDLSNTGDRNKLYDYPTRSLDFRSESIEGQAAMVGDYAGYKAGERGLTEAKAGIIENKLKGTGIFGL